MNNFTFIPISIILIVASLITSSAQGKNEPVTPTKYLISMVDKSIEYIGEIEKGTKDSIWINVGEEQLSFHIEEITTIQPIDEEHAYENYERCAARYVLAPSAMGLKRDEAYYQNLFIFGSLFNVGVTDNFSMTGGVLLPLIVYGELVSYYTPKFSVQIKPKLHFGTGMVGGFSLDIFDFEPYEFMLVPFANMTIGDVNNNVTIGFGYGIEDWESQNEVTARMLAVKFKPLKRVSIVSENTMMFKDDSFIRERGNRYFGFHVLRYFKRKNSFDIGILTLKMFNDNIILPYFSYTRAF